MLHNASLFTDNPTIVRLLLEAGADPNALDDGGNTPLHDGVQNGNPMVVLSLVRLGGNPEAQNNYGATPLHYAVAYANRRIVSILLDAGANPDLRDNDGRTALHYAARNAGDPASVVTALLASRADPNAAANDGWTPLHHVLRYSEDPAPVVHALLAAGADPSVKNSDGLTGLHLAVGFADNPAPVVNGLLAAGADPNAATPTGFSVIHAGVTYMGSTVFISRLLDAGAHLPQLHAAVLTDEESELASLLATGGDANEADDAGWTPLHFAVLVASSTVIERLLRAGADPNAINNDGWSPLRLTAGFGKEDRVVAIRLLVDYGANVEARQPATGMTALGYAVLNNSYGSVINALLEAGANPGSDDTRVDADGQTPLHHAAIRSIPYSGDSVTTQLSVIRKLLQLGADPHISDGEGNTALHYAAERTDDPAVLLALLNAGARVDDRNNDGKLPLDLAAANDAITENAIFERLHAGEPVEGYMSVGESTTGMISANDATLSTGNRYDDWGIVVHRSGTIEITMTSRAVDSYVILARGLRNTWEWAELARDDDGGEGLNALLVAEVEPGIYLITATGGGPSDETGSYRLSVKWR